MGEGRKGRGREDKRERKDWMSKEKKIEERGKEGEEIGRIISEKWKEERKGSEREKK